MSRWTENKYKYRKNYDVWIDGSYHIYKVYTSQGVFTVRRHRLDYKQTLKNLAAAGYSNISIVDLGREVTI